MVIPASENLSITSRNGAKKATDSSHLPLQELAPELFSNVIFNSSKILMKKEMSSIKIITCSGAPPDSIRMMTPPVQPEEPAQSTTNVAVDMIVDGNGSDLIKTNAVLTENQESSNLSASNAKNRQRSVMSRRQ